MTIGPFLSPSLNKLLKQIFHFRSAAFDDIIIEKSIFRNCDFFFCTASTHECHCSWQIGGCAFNSSLSFVIIGILDKLCKLCSRNVAFGGSWSIRETSQSVDASTNSDLVLSIFALFEQTQHCAVWTISHKMKRKYFFWTEVLRSSVSFQRLQLATSEKRCRRLFCH